MLMGDGLDKRKRAKDRKRVTLNMPIELHERIKREWADAKAGGDMNRGMWLMLSEKGFEEAAEFLRTNTTWIYSKKKGRRKKS